VSEPRVRLRFDRTERILTGDEGRILVRWLVDAGTTPSKALARRVRKHFRVESDAPMNLERAELAALREVLAAADVENHVGLTRLQQMLSD
jgi:hypothetical protein